MLSKPRVAQKQTYQERGVALRCFDLHIKHQAMQQLASKRTLRTRRVPLIVASSNDLSATGIFKINCCRRRCPQSFGKELAGPKVSDRGDRIKVSFIGLILSEAANIPGLSQTPGKGVLHPAQFGKQLVSSQIASCGPCKRLKLGRLDYSDAHHWSYWGPIRSIQTKKFDRGRRF